MADSRAEAATMLRHRESVYWQSARWFPTLVGAMLVASSVWPSLVVQAWTCAAGICLLGALVMLRQNKQLDSAWKCYKDQWKKEFFTGEEGRARNDWTVRDLIAIGFGLGCAGCLIGASRLMT